MIGTTLGGFEVRERLGAGGMGVVYSAWDFELKRLVALKALPDTARDDPQLWRRLRREAEAAAALSHPAICQIHRFLADTDPPALVLELVPGPALSTRVAEGPLPVLEAVTLVRRVAEGLAEAHAKNVIHRDIKPSNIVLTADGRPKLTDFGLAMLPEATRLTLVPSPMGTVPYMSPEQIRGEHPTPQMDVWSLGVVMFELLTGRRPFEGGIPELVLHEIQHADPPSLREASPEIPDPVAAVVQRALERDPTARYADGGAMAHDLLLVEQSLVSGTLPLDELPHTHRRRRARREQVARVLAPAVLAAVVALILWQWPFSGNGLPEMTVSRITENPWWEGEPSLSPDGARVAYAALKEGNFDIYICSTDGGRPFRLTDDPAEDGSPIWFPDGNDLLFVSTRSGDAGIWRTGQYGGDAMLLLNKALDPAISPDGRWLACAMQDEHGESRIAVAPLENPEAVRIITGGDDGVMAHAGPSWSPDSRRICYSAYDGLWVIDRTGVGAIRVAAVDDFHEDPVWAPDGRHIYYGSMERQTARISRVSVSGHKTEHVTLGTGPERHPTLSASGDRLVYSTQRNDRDLVLRDLDSGQESRIESVATDMMPTLSADATMLVFVSDRWGGTSDLWIQDLRDRRPVGEPRLLLDADLRCAMPEFAPDSRRIAFYVIDADMRHLMMTDVRGGRPVALTAGAVNDQQPHWSPDGRELVFVSDRGGRQGLWRLEVTAGAEHAEPMPIETGNLQLWMPRWSPSGRSIAGVAIVDGELDLWICGLEGTLRRVTRGASVTRLRWGADDTEIWAVGSWGGKNAELRIVDLETGDGVAPVLPVTFQLTNEDPSIELSVPMGILVYTEAASSGDLWLLQARHGSF